VLTDIADEEIVHAGEFLKLLKELEPTEAVFYEEGETEVREMMEKIAAGAPEGTVSERRPVAGAETSGGRNQDPQPIMAAKPVLEADVEVQEAPESDPPSVGNLINK
jgi:rubrerythrin